MKYSVVTYICTACMCLSCSHKTVFPFQWVTMPSEVTEILAEHYDNKNCGAEHNIYNIGVRNDIEPQNGVYWYCGMGPHFPHKFFVYYNDVAYVLKGDVEHSSDSILQDYANCVNALNISRNDSTIYINVIEATIAGKDIKYPNKTKVHIRELPIDTLNGEWLLQICKRQSGKKIEWDRCGEASNVSIKIQDDYYTLFFNTKSQDTTYNKIEQLHLKEAYYYNNKLFLCLSKTNHDRSTVSFIISKCKKDI